jgi:hypothetical protein
MRRDTALQDHLLSAPEFSRARQGVRCAGRLRRCSVIPRHDRHDADPADAAIAAVRRTAAVLAGYRTGQAERAVHTAHVLPTMAADFVSRGRSVSDATRPCGAARAEEEVALSRPLSTRLAIRRSPDPIGHRILPVLARVQPDFTPAGLASRGHLRGAAHFLMTPQNYTSESRDWNGSP